MKPQLTSVYDHPVFFWRLLSSSISTNVRVVNTVFRGNHSRPTPRIHLDQASKQKCKQARPKLKCLARDRATDGAVAQCQQHSRSQLSHHTRLSDSPCALQWCWCCCVHQCTVPLLFPHHHQQERPILKKESNSQLQMCCLLKVFCVSCSGHYHNKKKTLRNCGCEVYDGATSTTCQWQTVPVYHLIRCYHCKCSV